MLLEKYSHSDRDPWIWTLAQLTDVPDIVRMAQSLFQCEIDSFFTPDPNLFSRNVAMGIIRQMYNIFHEQLLIARHRDTDDLMAYTWTSRYAYMSYAHEEMAEVRFAHVDLALPARTRVRLVAQMIQHWYIWAQRSGIPILVSTSIRRDQEAFMRLHIAAGFDLRGSIGYLKVLPPALPIQKSGKV
jgi:hypothetical protein